MFSLKDYQMKNKVGNAKAGIIRGSWAAKTVYEEPKIAVSESPKEYFHLFFLDCNLDCDSKTFVILPSFVSTSKLKGLGGAYRMCWFLKAFDSFSTYSSSASFVCFESRVTAKFLLAIMSYFDYWNQFNLRTSILVINY